MEGQVRIDKMEMKVIDLASKTSINERKKTITATEMTFADVQLQPHHYQAT